MRNDTHILCFGELLLRLSPEGGGHLFQGSRLAAHFGGAEANVAVALARIGVPSALVSVVPDDAIGDGAVDAVRRHGVDVSRVLRASGRLGLYFLQPGAGLRPASIVYDRRGSSFATTPGSAYDWPRLLEGAAWLHLSGIVPAIGPELVEVGLAAMTAARAAGARVSFDGNFRANLWQRWCADPAPILADYFALADLAFAGPRDAALILGRDFDGDGPTQSRAAAAAMFDRFPALTAMASTIRTILGPDLHRLTARIDTPSDSFVSGPLDVPAIVDRIGSGDAFAAGVLARVDDGLAVAASTGLALAALKHGTPGDHGLTTARELAAFDSSLRDVQR